MRLLSIEKHECTGSRLGRGSIAPQRRRQRLFLPTVRSKRRTMIAQSNAETAGRRNVPRWQAHNDALVQGRPTSR
jgi:hypothetical protein